MSAISGISSGSNISFSSNEEDEKRVSADQVGQMASVIQSMISNLTDQLLEAMDSVSGTSADSTSTDTDTSTTTDASTTTDDTDDTSSTATSSTDDSDATSTSSSEPTEAEQMMFQLGEDMEQTVTGVSTDACNNQSAQDGANEV